VVRDSATSNSSGFSPKSPEYRRFVIAFVAAGTATFAQMYSPQGILPMIAADLDISASQSSLTVGTATLGVAIGVIPWARISDRIGRIATMRVSIVAAMIVGFLVPLAPEFGGVLALRFVEGLLLAGLPAVALTTINEEISRKAIGIAAGSYIAGNTFGGLLGRLIAAPAAEVGGWRFGLFAVSFLALISTIVFLIAMPKSQGFTRKDPSRRVHVWREIWSNLKTPGVAVILAQGFLLMGGFVAIYNYLAFRLEQAPYFFSATLVSLLFVSYLAGTFSSRAVWRLTRSRSSTAVLLGAIAVTILGAVITLAANVIIILTGLVIMTAGFFAAHSISSGALVARATIGKSQAAPMYNLFYYAGSTVIGWLGGVAYLWFGWGGTVSMVIAFAAFSGMLILWFAKSHGGFAAIDAQSQSRE
jgi:YNFM family putative membrane transporter